MKLTGKIGVLVALSDSNGNEFVTEYISKVMQYLRISVISQIEVKVQGISQSALESIIRYESNKIKKAIDKKISRLLHYKNYIIKSKEVRYYLMIMILAILKKIIKK